MMMTSSQTRTSLSGVMVRPRWRGHSSVCAIRIAPTNLRIHAVMAGSRRADRTVPVGLVSLSGEFDPAFNMRFSSVIILPFPSGEDSIITC